jgi:hypothetical protein
MRWANEAYDHAKHIHDRAVCDEVARKAAEIQWDEENPMDGVGSFSLNPYSRSDPARVKQLKEELAFAAATRDFVVSRICDALV